MKRLTTRPAFALALAPFVAVDPALDIAYAATCTDGAALPAWLTFDPRTGLLAGTPDDADAGVFDLRVTASAAFRSAKGEGSPSGV